MARGSRVSPTKCHVCGLALDPDAVNLGKLVLERPDFNPNADDPIETIGFCSTLCRMKYLHPLHESEVCDLDGCDKRPSGAVMISTRSSDFRERFVFDFCSDDHAVEWIRLNHQ